MSIKIVKNYTYAAVIFSNIENEIFFKVREAMSLSSMVKRIYDAKEKTVMNKFKCTALIGLKYSVKLRCINLFYIENSFA